jgi:hypothetical protein
MRKILAVALVTLAAACGSEDKEEPIRYGAPGAPTWEEQDAATTAAMTFESSLAFQASTEPAAGAAGLGDQLAASMGGSYAAAKMASAWSAKTGGGAVRQAFDTGGMDPACVSTREADGVTTVTWAGCVIEADEYDPLSGDSMSMRVEIDGTLTWTPTIGRTSWDIGERLWMTMTSDGETIAMSGTAGLQGSTTITGATIEASTASVADVTTNYMGMRFRQTLATTLEADLAYQADPFCITGGWLRVEQRRGGDMQTMPNQGWYFEWTGCGAFTVARGG